MAEDIGARLTEIQAALAVIDTQAASIVAVIVARRAQLADLAAQRQALVTEVAVMTQPMLDADWRDTLRDSGDTSQP